MPTTTQTITIEEHEPNNIYPNSKESITIKLNGKYFNSESFRSSSAQEKSTFIYDTIGEILGDLYVRPKLFKDE